MPGQHIRGHQPAACSSTWSDERHDPEAGAAWAWLRGPTQARAEGSPGRVRPTAPVPDRAPPDPSGVPGRGQLVTRSRGTQVDEVPGAEVTARRILRPSSSGCAPPRGVGGRVVKALIAAERMGCGVVVRITARRCRSAAPAGTSGGAPGTTSSGRRSILTSSSSTRPRVGEERGRNELPRTGARLAGPGRRGSGEVDGRWAPSLATHRTTLIPRGRRPRAAPGGRAHIW